MISSGRDQFRRYGVLILTLRKIAGFLPVPVLRWLGCLPGRLGVLGRYVVGSRTFSDIGDVVYISSNCILKNVEKLSVGSRVSIHEFCYIDAVGGIRIGDDVSIAHACSILSSNHTWDDHRVPIKYNAVKNAPVEIGNDVWIGCGARILAGTTINSRVVVAAGAVVRGNLESGFLYGGIPARKLRSL